MKKNIQRRLPVYLWGFLIGVFVVFLVTRAKKAFAPEFADELDLRPVVELKTDGILRLRLGEEPGKILAWGFPSQVAIGRKVRGKDKVEPVAMVEYRDLVEKEVALGPMPGEGEYELRARFYACAYPGEKYCSRILLEQPILVSGRPEAAAEAVVSVDVGAAAARAAGRGATQGTP